LDASAQYIRHGAIGEAVLDRLLGREEAVAFA